MSVCGVMRSTGTINSLKQPPTQRLGDVCKGSFVPVSSQHQQRGHCTLQQTQKSSTGKHGRWRVTAGEGTSQLEGGPKGRAERQEGWRDERLESDCWRLSGALCSEGTGLNQKRYENWLADCTCFLKTVMKAWWRKRRGNGDLQLCSIGKETQKQAQPMRLNVDKHTLIRAAQGTEVEVCAHSFLYAWENTSSDEDAAGKEIEQEVIVRRTQKSGTFTENNSETCSRQLKYLSD